MKTGYKYDSKLGLIVKSPQVINAGQYKGVLLCDRDGVIIEELHYLNDPNRVKLITGASKTLKAAIDYGWAIAVVSNQAGIAKGLISFDEYIEVSKKMEKLLKIQGVNIDLILACPQHSSSRDPLLTNMSTCMRKPEPGMLNYACLLLGVKVQNSCMIGDKLCDIEAGHRLGCKHLIHVATGHGMKHRNDVLDFAELYNLKLITTNSIGDIDPLIFYQNN